MTEDVGKDAGRSLRITEQVRHLTRFASLQLLVQVMTVATGFVIVRLLNKEQYALFTLTMAMLTTANVLSDSGLSAGMFSIGTRIWRDIAEVQRMQLEAVRLRTMFGLTALGLIIPALVVMLLHRGRSTAEILGLCALVTMGALANFVYVSGSIVLKLRGETTLVQRAELAGVLSRLLATLLAAATWMTASTAMLAAVIALWMQRLLVSKWTHPADISPIETPRYQAALTKIVTKQLPQVVYFAIQGQLTVLLIATFGATSAIADIGALSRIAVLFAVVTGVVNTVIVPSIARCESKALLGRRLILTIITYTAFSVLIVTIVRMAPGPILSVLGPPYAHLRSELLLLTVATSLGGLSTLLASLNIARGWVRFTWIIPPTTIGLQIIILPQLVLSREQDVITLSLISTIPAVLAGLAMTIHGFNTDRVGQSDSNSRSAPVC